MERILSMLVKNHFDDCPYNCNNEGKLLDTNKGVLVPCPHCSEKKKELLKQGYIETDNESQIPLSDVLGIDNPYLSTKFVYEGIIPDGEMLFLDTDSVSYQNDTATNLYLGLTIGELPEESICFGISIKGKIDRFIYPMLAKAYMSGLSIARVYSCSEYSRLSFDTTADLGGIFTADICFMLINEGCNKSDLASAKGLMQTRALKGKPTIFITTWSIEACSLLLAEYRDEPSYYLAKACFVKYKVSKNKPSKYIKNITGVENEQLGTFNIDSIPDAPKGVSLSSIL